MSDAAMRLLVGTTKGAFILDGDSDRSHWTVRGPYCDGWTINHVIGDPATGTMWAGGGGDFKVVPEAHVVRNYATGRADSRELPGSSPVSHFARSGQGVFQAMAAVAKLGYALA